MKKTAAFCAVLMITAIMLSCRAHAVEGVSAKAAVLIEAYSGQILYAENENTKLPMASVTKTMGLLLWAEDIAEGKLSLDDEVTASSYAGSMTGSVIWLTAGEKMTAGELLKAIVIASANDACVAMAEHTDVTEEAFVKRMNKRAKELGMKNTHYVNCVGYDDKKHYSTAYDLALVTAELMKHEVYREYMLTWLDYLRGDATQLVNTNKMVKWYTGLLGGKTGTTDLAGCCLAACAERSEFRLVAVVLGCENDNARFDSAEALLDYGFSSFEQLSPKIEREKLINIDVKHGVQKSVGTMLLNHNICVVPKGRSSAVEYEYTFVESVTAPVEQGQFLGEYLVTIDGNEIFKTALVADSAVAEMDFFTSLARMAAQLLRM